MDEQELKFEEWWQKQLKIGWCKPNHRGIAWDAYRYGQKESVPAETLVMPKIAEALIGIREDGVVFLRHRQGDVYCGRIDPVNRDRDLKRAKEVISKINSNFSA